MIEQIKKQQQVFLWSIIVVLAVALAVTAKLLFNQQNINRQQVLTAKKQLTTGASRVNPQELWVHDFTLKADLTHKRIEALEKSLAQLLKINTPPITIGATTDSLPTKEVTTAGNLKQDLANIFANSQQTSQLPPPNLEAGQELLPAKSSSIFKNQGLKKISLNLDRSPSQQKLLKTTDNHIPAGSFAQAVLLGGVDASTAIQAASDPRPILLRLTDPGTLPRQFKSDLQGCHVLAASYGDLSSERVYMRLEKLGCVEHKTGEIMEMAIQGYVAGEDGRAGVRGAVIDKAGASMRNAMIGGFFSSIGKFLAQAKTPILFSPTTGLTQNTPITGADLLQQSAANGVGGALDQYANFYIKRAEQMQPVIQVAAGRIVDLIFTQGVDLASSLLRQVLSKTHDQSRHQQVQNLEASRSMPAWTSKENKEHADHS